MAGESSKSGRSAAGAAKVPATAESATARVEKATILFKVCGVSECIGEVLNGCLGGCLVICLDRNKTHLYMSQGLVSTG